MPLPWFFFISPKPSQAVSYMSKLKILNGQFIPLCSIMWFLSICMLNASPFSLFPGLRRFRKIMETQKHFGKQRKNQQISVCIGIYVIIT